MPRKTTLYIDIDDTIIAQVLPGSGFDLRPCVMQLRVLGRVYECCWFTMWPHTTPKRPGSYQDGVSIVTMMSCLPYVTIVLILQQHEEEISEKLQLDWIVGRF